MKNNYYRKSDPNEQVKAEQYSPKSEGAWYMFETVDGYRHADAGEWIVKDRSGTRVFSADEFAALYEPVEDDVKRTSVVGLPQAAPNPDDIAMSASAVVAGWDVGTGDATDVFDNLARFSGDQAKRRPKLRRIRVEIERPDGRVFTTVLTTTGSGRLIDNGGKLTLDAADTNADMLIVLSPEKARKWLKRLKKRGVI